ncbi:hypothetical protein WJX73_004774 [Symbiochloris irregularis]|uniref:FH2 domain-containing protein n=1 Tax=Symbiochloris irregularis TaxID=706552 RepID=A0AAW1NE80_9CHLO
MRSSFGGLRSLFDLGHGSKSGQPLLPLQLTKRIWGFVLEEDREGARRPESTVKGQLSLSEYRAFLQHAAAGLAATHTKRANLRFITVGSRTVPDAESILHDCVCSMLQVPNPASKAPSGWEQPPGLGTATMSTVFEACQEVYNWLALDEDNIAVLHVRGVSGTAERFLHLIAACYSMFNMQCAYFEEALAAMSPSAQQVVRSFGIAQHRCGHWVRQVLFEPLPRNKRSRRLRRIVLPVLQTQLEVQDGGWLARVGGQAEQARRKLQSSCSLLVVYQQGRQVWSGAVATEETDQVGFTMDIPITGDITLALWFGAHKLEGESPQLAVTFHTLFDNTEVLRMSHPDLDIPPRSILTKSSQWREGFFMDVVIDVAAEPDAAQKREEEALLLHLQALRDSWWDTISYGPEANPDSRGALAASGPAPERWASLPSSPHAGPAASSSGASEGLARSRTMAAPPRFKVLHWTKVAAPPVDCMWQQLPLPLPQLTQQCSAELLRLFGMQPPTSKGLRGAKAAAAKAQADKQPLRFISSSRANNLAIMLTRFQALQSPDQLQAALYSGSAFNIEQLGLLLQMAPTEAEAKSLTTWLNQPGNTIPDLAEAEQYLVIMARIPSFKGKVAALMFRQQYADIMHDAMLSLQVIDSACEQVRSSRNLKLAAAAAIVAGNAVNAGTPYGDAKAVRLDSLLKLADLKVAASAAALSNALRGI